MIFYKILVMCAVILMIALNGVASATNLLGVKISQLWQLFPFPFMPFSFVFMINWGSVFIGLLLFTFSLCFSKKRSPKVTKKLILLELISIFFNIAWLFATGNKYFISSVFIIAFLTISVWFVIKELQKNGETKSVWWWVWGVYLGWLIIATCVIGFSQLFYVYDSSIVFRPLFVYWILGVWVISTLLWYTTTKNIFTLWWWGLVLLTCFASYVL